LIATGTRIGSYEVVSAIGEGGMGAVYRAHDSKLNRDVAIKVLLPAVANDPDRLARFSREAQVLASLNHPNIAHIYGLEEASDVRALVMELVEGPTLADRLAKGALPLADALPIARQIAEALEAAHEQGIVHRDLKPANVKVRPDGTVKVLDFGLAKAMESGASSIASATMSPTISIHATQAGIILGTAAYMSPEQAAGKPVDKRSDLWAFGVVLLEMLTGRAVFGGETVSHVVASVLKDAPDFSALPVDTPAPIRKLLRRCLEKDRRKRLADASDARLDIDDAMAQPAGEVQPSSETLTRTERPAPSVWKRAVPVIAAFSAGAILAGAAAMLMKTRTAVPTVRALTYAPLSFEPGGNGDAVWSPDGKGIAFAGRQRDDEPRQIYVRYLNASTSTVLTHMDRDAIPFGWTTAGRIMFRSQSKPAGIWSISQTGGQAESLVDFESSRLRVSGPSVSVSRDGSAIAYYAFDDGKYGVWISAPPGSPAKRYNPAPFESATTLNAPRTQFSPDGKQLLLVRNAGQGEQTWLMPYPADASKPPRLIFEATMPLAAGTPMVSWMPDNRRVVMAISAGSEPSRLYLADTASGAFTLLSSGTTPESQPSVSPDGTRLAFTELIADQDVIQVDVRSGEVSPLVATRRNEDMPAWATNGAAMAYVTDRTGEKEIWLHYPNQPDRPVVTERDFPPGTTQWFMSPAISPDGTRIIYSRIERGSAGDLWMAAIGGGAPVRVTSGDERGGFAGSWSPDGVWFAYWAVAGSAGSLNRVRTTGQAKPEVVVARVTARGLTVPIWSPTGDWILYNDNGWRLVSPDGKTSRDLALKATVCAFSRDAVQLYCVRGEVQGGVLFSRPVAGGQEHAITRLSSNQVPTSDLNPSLKMTFTPDGQHLTFSARKAESNLWLLSGMQ